MNHDVTYRLAMDRIARLQAEAAAERLADPGRSRRRSIGGWEGRPARRPPSERILAWSPAGPPGRHGRPRATTQQQRAAGRRVPHDASLP